MYVNESIESEESKVSAPLTTSDNTEIAEEEVVGTEGFIKKEEDPEKVNSLRLSTIKKLENQIESIQNAQKKVIDFMSNVYSESGNKITRRDSRALTKAKQKINAEAHLNKLRRQVSILQNANPARISSKDIKSIEEKAILIYRKAIQNINLGERNADDRKKELLERPTDEELNQAKANAKEFKKTEKNLQKEVDREVKAYKKEEKEQHEAEYRQKKQEASEKIKEMKKQIRDIKHETKASKFANRFGNGVPVTESFNYVNGEIDDIAFESVLDTLDGAISDVEIGKNSDIFENVYAEGSDAAFEAFLNEVTELSEEAYSDAIEYYLEPVNLYAVESTLCTIIDDIASESYGFVEADASDYYFGFLLQDSLDEVREQIAIAEEASLSSVVKGVGKFFRGVRDAKHAVERGVGNTLQKVKDTSTSIKSAVNNEKNYIADEAERVSSEYLKKIAEYGKMITTMRQTISKKLSVVKGGLSALGKVNELREAHGLLTPGGRFSIAEDELANAKAKIKDYANKKYSGKDIKKIFESAEKKVNKAVEIYTRLMGDKRSGAKGEIDKYFASNPDIIDQEYIHKVKEDRKAKDSKVEESGRILKLQKELRTTKTSDPASDATRSAAKVLQKIEKTKGLIADAEAKGDTAKVHSLTNTLKKLESDHQELRDSANDLRNGNSRNNDKVSSNPRVSKNRNANTSSQKTSVKSTLEKLRAAQDAFNDAKDNWLAEKNANGNNVKLTKAYKALEDAKSELNDAKQSKDRKRINAANSALSAAQSAYDYLQKQHSKKSASDQSKIETFRLEMERAKTRLNAAQKEYNRVLKANGTAAVAGFSVLASEIAEIALEAHTIDPEDWTDTMVDAIIEEYLNSEGYVNYLAQEAISFRMSDVKKNLEYQANKAKKFLSSKHDIGELVVFLITFIESFIDSIIMQIQGRSMPVGAANILIKELRVYSSAIVDYLKFVISGDLDNATSSYNFIIKCIEDSEKGVLDKYQHAVYKNFTNAHTLELADNAQTKQAIQEFNRAKNTFTMVRKKFEKLDTKTSISQDVHDQMTTIISASMKYLGHMSELFKYATNFTRDDDVKMNGENKSFGQLKSVRSFSDYGDNMSNITL